jgi:hypothetical protein
VATTAASVTEFSCRRYDPRTWAFELGCSRIVFVGFYIGASFGTSACSVLDGVVLVFRHEDGVTKVRMSIDMTLHTIA